MTKFNTNLIVIYTLILLCYFCNISLVKSKVVDFGNGDVEFSPFFDYYDINEGKLLLSDFSFV